MSEPSDGGLSVMRGPSGFQMAVLGWLESRSDWNRIHGELGMALAASMQSISEDEEVLHVAKAALLGSSGYGPLVATVTNHRLLLVAVTGWRGKRIKTWEFPFVSLNAVNVVVEGAHGEVIELLTRNGRVTLGLYGEPSMDYAVRLREAVSGSTN